MGHRQANKHKKIKNDFKKIYVSQAMMLAQPLAYLYKVNNTQAEYYSF